LEFRKRLITKFTFLFGEPNAEEPENGGEFNERTQFAKHWGWYQSIYHIAQGDLSRFEAVTKHKLIECLTYLTFEKQKQEIEQRELNKIQKR
jgi:hypothetical protein